MPIECPLFTRVCTEIFGEIWSANEHRIMTQAIVMLEWADLDPRLGLRSLGNWAPAVLPDILQSVRNRGALLNELLSAVAENLPVAICFPTLPLPPVAFTPGWLASELELELRAVVAGLSAASARNRNVRVLSPQQIDRLSPLAARMDVRSELMNGFPYHLAHASILAQQIVELLSNIVPKKGLITDLDGTLWRGILGELGADGVSWDLDRHGHMHAVYQQLLHSLAEAGVLIAVASKNEPALVEAAFRRQDMILPATAVIPWQVHWGPKSESVTRILQSWNIGADAVVFVDDSAAEIAEVQSIHPQMECIEFPTDQPQAMYEVLRHLRDLFGKVAISAEDGIRRQSIRNVLEISDYKNIAAGSPNRFLEQAEAELSFSFAKEPLDPRAAELINKTNQFNLNGRRYTPSEWWKYVRNPETFLLVVSYRDKYGPLGKIAVLTGQRRKAVLRIDNWVMSCRAFGRRIEFKCLEVLLDKYDAMEVAFDFLPTERNGPLRTFLELILGHTPTSGCTASRSELLANSPETFHTIAELSNG